MTHTVADIAAALGADLQGDGRIRVVGAAEPSSAGPEHLALAMTPAYAEGLGQGRARAAVVWAGADWRALGLEAALVVPRPRYAMAGSPACSTPVPTSRPASIPPP
jgi:UDP-3-O-[3-hydroxymyristoyl] glucosamine N-acyltransferase